MHAESNRRLRAALESGRLLGECDLANLELTEVPSEVVRMPNLRVLSLQGNRITEIPSAIANLSALRVLALDDNQIASLPANIGNLACLERLTLSGNLLTALPSEIGKLCSLESLTVSRNRLMSLPPEVGRLSNLETLAASSNQLRGLPAEISGLRNLQVLSLTNNKLTRLPPYIASMLRAGLVLGIEGNPFAGPVIELYERAPSVLAAYLESLTSAVPRYEAKMLLVGAGNVGKTSLLTALRGGRFLAGRETTHGIEVHPVALHHPSAGRDMTVFAWDFGGQEIYRATHQLFFTRNALYLIVWNPREGPEQAEVAGWLRRIRQRINTNGRVFIVATHCAGERHPDLDYSTLAAEFPALLAGSFDTDSSTGDGIGELGHAVAAELSRLPQVGQVVSPHWIAAREEILGFADTEPQISFEKFESVCRRHGLGADQAIALAETLHLNGQVIYHSDDETFDGFVVLNPEWLTKAISYVLEDEVTRQAGGVLDHTRLRQIWGKRANGVVYPARYHPYFLRLMEKYDVSYRLADEDDRSLVAHLVPHERPTLPWNSAPAIPPGVRRIGMVCRLSEPVPGLIAWLTVRHHDAATGKHWRNGVFLRHPIEVYASEALLELRTPTELIVDVRAPSPDFFFSVLRYSIEGLITRRWPGVSYELLIRCPTVTDADLCCPGMIPMQDLLVYREEGETRFLCAKCRTRHDISVLLTGFAQPAVSLQTELDRLHAQFRADIASVGAQVSDLQATAADTAHVIRQLLRAVSTEVTDCPRLFTLARGPQTRGTRRLRADLDHFRLVLWCEHPGYWHPWPAAAYSVDQPKEWAAKIAPYAALVFRALQLTVPVATGIVGVALTAAQSSKVQAELKLMATIISELPSNEPGHLLSPPPTSDGSEMTVAQGAAWRALRALLLSVDPARSFGDLRRVQSPAGEFLWVCPEHHAAYDPGLPSIPVTITGNADPAVSLDPPADSRR